MQYIETGEIISLHGIRGEVKVYPWADYPQFLEEFDTFYIQKNKMYYQPLHAVNVRTHKNVVIIQFEGIDNTETARNLIGKTLYLDRDEIELEENTYFVADLIGCRVVNYLDGTEIGQITDVQNLGAGDIYFIQTARGKQVLFPAVDEFLMGTDIENKVVKVKVIEGMFDEN